MMGCPPHGKTAKVRKIGDSASVFYGIIVDARDGRRATRGGLRDDTVVRVAERCRTWLGVRCCGGMGRRMAMRDGPRAFGVRHHHFCGGMGWHMVETGNGRHVAGRLLLWRDGVAVISNIVIFLNL